MSETVDIKSQISSNSDLVESKVRIEGNGQSSDQISNGFIGPDVSDCVETKSKTIDSEITICDTNGTTGMTRVTQMNGFNGMRNTDSDSTQAPDVCSGIQSTDISDGVDDMREDPKQDSSASISAVPESDKEVIIIETVVKCNSDDVTLITDTTLRTTTHSSDHSLNQSSTDSSTESQTENNTSSAMTTTITTRPKQLKSLLKKGLKDKSIKGRNGKRVKFSETMQVFCDDWPQDLMPQIIALKSPTDFNLVEVQGYMFEPPVEYQDFLPFEPPPDYRDFIANSLCAFDNDLTINYIDDEEDDENNIKNEQKFVNEFTSKWESMILNNNETLEEEQIIGVLKEDAILQAIGSHISLPEEQLCPEDFPIHFQNDSNVKLADSELSDITSDDGNDGNDSSSPTGSLQDIQSDSSITSQDTIILINEFKDENNDKEFEIFSNKNSFNELKSSVNEEISCESVVKDSENHIKTHLFSNELNSESNSHSVICDKFGESIGDSHSMVSGGEDRDRVDSAQDVAHDIDRNDRKANETENDDRNAFNCQSVSDKKQLNSLPNNGSNDLPNDYSNAFKKNLMFYENMFTNNKNIKSEDNCKPNKPIKQSQQSHTVSHFVIQNTPKFPIITQTISNNTDNSVIQTNESSVELKQMANEVNSKAMNNKNNCQSMPSTHMRAQPTQQSQHIQQTQPNPNNWSTDEFIIEYTSEPKALVPSKRTASLSNFATAQMSANPMNPQMIRNNTNNNNIQYLSLKRNGEIPKQWFSNTYNNDLHNNSHQIGYQFPTIQRSLSPNPSLTSGNTRPVSPQQVYYHTLTRPQPPYNPRNPSTAHTMPVRLMYNRMSGPQPNQQRVSVRMPVMSQTLGRPHTQPPPYSYHIQQHSNEFPNPSEIRRRDGLNAYPHVLNQTPQAGALPVPPVNHNQNTSHTMTKDELEAFVAQDMQRTERIKKRYSMTEEDDPSFGFARRPSVRGIRPKFGTTDEILKQMQTQTNSSSIGGQSSGNHVSWPQNSQIIAINNINSNQIPTQQHNQSFQRKQPLFVRVGPQTPIPVKYMSEVSVPDAIQSSQPSHPNYVSTAPVMSRTLPRPQSLICQSNQIQTEEGLVIRVLNTRDQTKQIHRQLEQQKQKMSSMSSLTSNNVKPVMSSNDERGAPEGASSSPKHSSDVLFAKNLSTNSNSNANHKSEGMAVNRQQTNDTKKLVINEENKSTNDNTNEGIVYYSMNV